MKRHLRTSLAAMSVLALAAVGCETDDLDNGIDDPGVEDDGTVDDDGTMDDEDDLDGDMDEDA